MTARPQPSARPLFRAIRGAGGDGPRRADDFYPTPPDATRAILAAEGATLARLGAVWEPACGDGAIVRECAAAGLAVTASDVRDRGWPGTVTRSFYDWAAAAAPAILTNPPYCEINSRGRGRWLDHLAGLPGWTWCALLLNWDWPAARAGGMAGLHDRMPFARAWLLRWKVDFTGGGAPPQRNAWFIWDRTDPNPRREIHFLDRPQPRTRGRTDG